ncbi:MAG: hypothetical protein P8L37_05020 [Phycisphaerales bacterium]|nr:hypothetical protein [Phycisphaerales bacterium]
MSVVNKMILCVAVSAVAVFSTMVLVSCDKAQRDVAVDNIMKSIDEALGKYDVALKRVENGYEALRKTSVKIENGMLNAQVRSERAEDVLSESQVRVKRLKQSGATLVDQIKEDKFPLAIGGKSYTKPQAMELAAKVKDALQRAQEKLQGDEQVLSTYNTAAAQLSSQFNLAEEKLNKMRSDISLIKVKVGALKAQREAAGIAGDSGASIADQFESLQTEMDNLFVETETSLRQDQAAWARMETEMKGDDDLLESLQSEESQLDELERMFD